MFLPVLGNTKLAEFYFCSLTARCYFSNFFPKNNEAISAIVARGKKMYQGRSLPFRIAMTTIKMLFRFKVSIFINLVFDYKYSGKVESLISLVKYKIISSFKIENLSGMKGIMDKYFQNLF